MGASPPTGGVVARREARPRFLTSDEAVHAYDRECLSSQASRRVRGKPFRDFESTVFTVPKKDGRFRLCTDYVH
jgi:hypothetical protein